MKMPNSSEFVFLVCGAIGLGQRQGDVIGSRQFIDFSSCCAYLQKLLDGNE
jgi:hypothetical protein